MARLSTQVLLTTAAFHGSTCKTWQTTAKVDMVMTMTGFDGDILTLDEVAAHLEAGMRTIYRLAANGEIPAFKLGGTWRFSRSDIERRIKEQSTGGIEHVPSKVSDRRGQK